MMEYDSDFITKPKKFLLDNSTDLTTTPSYIELCKQYGFEHIKNNYCNKPGRIMSCTFRTESSHKQTKVGIFLSYNKN